MVQQSPETPWKNTGVRRLVRAALYSLAGLRTAFRDEAAFRQELALLAGLTPLALWLGDDGAERALLVASAWLVPIVELLNTAVEAVVDRIGMEHHALAGQAKDLGSAAVMLSIGLALAVWLLVLLG